MPGGHFRRATMRAIIHSIVFAVILAAQVWWVVDAPGCMCSGTPSVDEAQAIAACVFLGRVVSMEAPEPRPISELDNRKVISTGDIVRYVIVPSAIWKGAAADTLVVYSARGSPSCGFEMMPDGDYLLYARLWEPVTGSRDDREWAKGKPTGPVLMVDMCSRNSALISATQDIEELGEPIWRIE